jgi:hypothetical protein
VRAQAPQKLQRVEEAMIQIPQPLATEVQEALLRAIRELVAEKLPGADLVAAQSKEEIPTILPDEDEVSRELGEILSPKRTYALGLGWVQFPKKELIRVPAPAQFYAQEGLPILVPDDWPDYDDGNVFIPLPKGTHAITIEGVKLTV